jgi:hypothetical protein
LLVTGYWLLVAGYWLLVAGCWLLVAGYSSAAGRPVPPSFHCGGQALNFFTLLRFTSAGRPKKFFTSLTAGRRSVRLLVTGYWLLFTDYRVLGASPAGGPVAKFFH